jgi:hypothetical protein
MVHEAAGLVGDGFAGVFNGDNGVVSLDGEAVFEALGASGVVLEADTTYGAGALNVGFGEGEKGEVGERK